LFSKRGRTERERNQAEEDEVRLWAEVEIEEVLESEIFSKVTEITPKR
jgi:hypothetical protein